MLTVTADPGTNRINISGMTYDANGNVTNIPGTGTLGYDGRNRVTAFNGATERGYDSANRKIWWKAATGELFVDFWLPNGEKLASYHVPEAAYLNDPTFPGPIVAVAHVRYFWFGGRMVKIEGKAFQPWYVEWPQPDRLASHARHFPYGEANGSSSTDYKFATYQRESNGIDYAMNRYYSSTHGRFLSPDPYRASGGPGNPGSWNRYSYVEGDPVNAVDPQGLWTASLAALLYENFVFEGTRFSVDVWAPMPGGFFDYFFQIPRWPDPPQPWGAPGMVGPPPPPERPSWCGAIPDAIVIGTAATGGGIAVSSLGTELVVNLVSGQVDLFSVVGAGGGWYMGASAGVYVGGVWNLGNSNSAYSGTSTIFQGGFGGPVIGINGSTVLPLAAGGQLGVTIGASANVQGAALPLNFTGWVSQQAVNQITSLGNISDPGSAASWLANIFSGLISIRRQCL